MERWLIIGEGLIGRYWQQCLQQCGEHFKVLRRGDYGFDIAADKEELFTSLDAVWRWHGPFTYVINCAAYTYVDSAAEQLVLSMRCNGIYPVLLAQWCKEHGVKLLHYSSNYVYGHHAVYNGGLDRWYARGPLYLEDDPYSPCNWYGLTKMVGEYCRDVYEQVYIVRTSCVFGLAYLREDRSLHCTPLVDRILYDIIHSKDEEMFVDFGSYFSLCSLPDIYKASRYLLEDRQCRPATYHVVYSDYHCYYSLHCLLRDLLVKNGYDVRLRIKENLRGVHGDGTDYEGKLVVSSEVLEWRCSNLQYGNGLRSRSPYSVLGTSMLISKQLRHLDEALDEYVKLYIGKYADKGGK